LRGFAINSFFAALAGAALAWTAGTRDANAHPQYSPIRASIASSDEAPGTAIQGYGFYASSEAEAADAFRFGCTDADLREYVSNGCHRPVDSATSANALVTDAMRAFLLQRIREHRYEWITLQRAAIGPDRNPPPLPACLAPNANLEGLMSRLPPTQPSDADIEAATEPHKSELGKFRTAANTLTSGNLIRAAMTYDILKQSYDASCHGAPAPGDAATNCTDLQNQIQRVEAAFPSIFSTSIHQFQGTEVASFGDEERQPLTDAVKELLGSRFPQATSTAQRIARGNSIYAQKIGGGGADALSDLEKLVADAARDATTPAANTPAGTRAAMASALAHLNAAIDGVRSHYGRTALAVKLNHVCDTTLDSELTTDPNTVRQALMDLPEDQRQVAQAVLCQSHALQFARPLSACEGVTRNGDTTTVRRWDHSYPYASFVKETITHPAAPPGSPPVVSTTIDLVADGNVTNPEALRARMEHDANAWYNCQVGQIPSMTGIQGFKDVPHCPKNPGMDKPPVKFDIHFKLVSAAQATEPKVYLHKCYNAELSGDDRWNCRAVRQHTVKRCTDTFKLWQRNGRMGGSARWGVDLDDVLDNISRPPPNPPAPDPNPSPRSPLDRWREHVHEMAPACTPPDNPLTASAAQSARFCDCFAPPEGDPANDRQDSGNYTQATEPSVVIHEVGHDMALPDEYIDPTYPISPIGEHDSVMNTGDGDTGRIYPRHLRQILAPDQCPSAPAPALAGGHL
jgi:hypothetical protein